MRTSCASACSGFSTGIAAMVVQFGLAMMPLRISARACGLTSLTISGTSGSRRQAELLSMTVTPASANRGACAREVVAPAEKIAMSRPVGSAVAASSTVISPPAHGRVLPAVGAEVERVVHRADGDVDVGVAADHGDADLRGADQLEVDAGIGQRAEELGGDAGVRAHTGTNQRHLADVLVE